MNPIISTGRTQPKLIKTILTTGLIAGTLDITAASIQTLIYGRDPVRMYKFIASGVFGAEALAGGAFFAVCGFIFHYCIATGWVAFFFWLYPRVKFLSANRIVAGFVYGGFVWFMMNRVVLPLSNTPPIPFKVMPSLIGLSILIVAIGLPTSFLAARFFKDQNKG